MSILVIAFSVLIFTGCNGNKETVEKYTYMKDIVYTSALIEKDNNIYLYDKNYNYLEPIGEISRYKELSTLSEDGENIAYKYVDEKGLINIYNIKSRENKVLEIEEDGAVSYMQWFGKYIAVGIDENPTTYNYLIYDSETMELVNSCSGILIDVLDEGKTLVYGVNIKGVTSICINAEKVFTFNNTGEVLLGGSISPDRGEISFLTFLFDKETFQQKEFLYTGSIEDNKIKNMKIVDKPYEIFGDVQYDGDKAVILNEEEYSEMVNGEFHIQKLTELNPSIEENSIKLKEILKRTFTSEAIDINKSWTELGIKNITWFTK